MSHLMVYQCVVVHMLVLVGNDAPIAVAGSSFTLEHELKHIAGDAVLQRDDVMVDTAASPLLYVDIGQPYVLAVGCLEAIEIQRRSLAHVSLYNLRAKKIAVVGGIVAKEELRLGSLAQNDEHATVDHKVHV